MRKTSSLIVLVLIASACSKATPPTSNADTTLTVVTTVAPITNLVHNIGGDLVTVVGLVPEGVNSHTFEPAPSDAAILAAADLVFVNGLHLEEPSISLAEQNISPAARIVTLADQAITTEEWIFDFSFPEAAGDPNPHLWTNPLYVKRYIRSISQILSLADPANAETFERNRDLLLGRYEQLADALRTATATVPVGQRKLLTYHDSFPYMARDFGWEIIGAIQPSDFHEPSAREVASLIDQIRAEKIPAIFGSEVFPSPVLETIARETGAKYYDNLRDDDLPGDPGEADHSLLGLLIFDFTTMVEAMGGDASALKSVDSSNLGPENTVSYRS